MEINEKRVYQQIRNFERALEGYNHNEPLSRYLTRFFKENKQMGSSDRRMTSRFCYNYFRLGNGLSNYDLKERLAFAEYLCTTDSAVVHVLKPELSSSISEDISEKLEILTELYGLDQKDVFPFLDHLSESVSASEFVKSQFIQPNLFIRIRSGKEDFVRKMFDRHGIIYEILSNNTFALANGTNLKQVADLEGMYEVQDFSSQRTIEFVEAKSNENWWDACAASGGKALLFLDKYPNTNLLVSDIRLSILRNLDERFEKADIRTAYRKKILDLSNSVSSVMKGEEFDGIIVDVPCSGSGTWGRTPEMIQQFSLEKLESFTTLQRRIVSNVIPFLKSGGSLLYITCSIYKEENEEAVQFLLDNFELKLEKMKVIQGYKDKADSMFAAHFIKRS